MTTRKSTWETAPGELVAPPLTTFDSAPAAVAMPRHTAVTAALRWKRCNRLDTIGFGARTCGCELVSGSRKQIPCRIIFWLFISGLPYISTNGSRRGQATNGARGDSEVPGLRWLEPRAGPRGRVPCPMTDVGYGGRPKPDRPK